MKDYFLAFFKLLWQIVNSLLETAFFLFIIYLMAKYLLSNNLFNTIVYILPFFLGLSLFLKGYFLHQHNQEFPNKSDFYTSIAYLLVGIGITCLPLFIDYNKLFSS